MRLDQVENPTGEPDEPDEPDEREHPDAAGDRGFVAFIVVSSEFDMEPV
jgi:hypothetical protein